MTRAESIKVLNVDVLNTDGEELLREYTQGCLFTPNIDHFVLLQKDNEFYQAYQTAEYVVLDSQVIYLLWKLCRKSFKTKIAGADFFPRFCEYHKNNDKITMFILGGMDGVAEKVCNKLNAQAERTIVVGAYSPPMDFDNNETEHAKIFNLINATNANVLAVALGTPKQEKWIYKNRRYLPNVTMLMGIGATLDFMIGKQKRAPRWIQNIGFEWFYRLIHDPKRLMKRYLIRDVQFFYYLITDVLRLYKNPFEK